MVSLLSMSAYKLTSYVIIILFYLSPWYYIQNQRIPKDHEKKNKY